MNYEDQEKYLQDKLTKFGEAMRRVAEDIIGEVECRYLPHVMSDTESNVSFQTAACIKEILRGKFEVLDNGICVNGVYVHLTNYQDLATCIYNAAKDKIENATIKELESKISTLKSELESAYRRF